MEERFTAEMLVDYAAKQRGVGVEHFGVAPAVVLSWATRTVQSLVAAAGAQQAQHWMYGEQYPLYTGNVGGRRVSFTRVPIGAPATIVRMEELIACGARTFLGFGAAGSLQPDAPVGTSLIPTSCVSEEGTSQHYMDRATPLRPSGGLVELLRAACDAESVAVLSGPLWTTDAPYRELTSKIDSYRQRGVLGVDMETSAMYALGQFRGVKVCNLLVVSDELWREWRPAFGQPEFLEAVQRAQQAILRCLATLGD